VRLLAAALVALVALATSTGCNLILGLEPTTQIETIDAPGGAPGDGGGPDAPDAAGGADGDGGEPPDFCAALEATSEPLHLCTDFADGGDLAAAGFDGSDVVDGVIAIEDAALHARIGLGVDAAAARARRTLALAEHPARLEISARMRIASTCVTATQRARVLTIEVRDAPPALPPFIYSLDVDAAQALLQEATLTPQGSYTTRLAGLDPPRLDAWVEVSLTLDLDGSDAFLRTRFDGHIGQLHAGVPAARFDPPVVTVGVSAAGNHLACDVLVDDLAIRELPE